ncbi:putative zinc-binding protein [Paenibacillus sp. DYY-L-2]|uniref:putative zinc-binding protein n=1 Tax=Paenibacillus sp. DYY-L-2 TaxID=3447013 RepID=UPI003F502F0D
MKNNNLPLVYSCSGCSSAAQTANRIAIKMDREKIAEMSCIAGVGGDGSLEIMKKRPRTPVHDRSSRAYSSINIYRLKQIIEILDGVKFHILAADKIFNIPEPGQCLFIRKPYPFIDFGLAAVRAKCRQFGR